MKGLIKKLLTGALAVSLALVATLTNVAAVNTTAGKSVRVTISYSNVKGADGEKGEQGAGDAVKALIESLEVLGGETADVG